MNTYEKIQVKINNVKEWNQEAGNKLHDQLHRAANARWTREELSELLKQEDDVADSHYSDDDVQHAEIRDIQEDIIILFGEEKA
jgi:hypothetical protein